MTCLRIWGSSFMAELDWTNLEDIGVVLVDDEEDEWIRVFGWLLCEWSVLPVANTEAHKVSFAKKSSWN